MAAIAAVVGGPLVGIAEAAPGYTDPSSPLTSASAGTAPVTTTAPGAIKLTFDKALNPPSYPIASQASTLTVHQGIPLFPCTTSLDPANNHTLVCTPSGGTTFTDGLYKIDYKANSALPDTGAVTGTRYFLLDTTPP